MALKKLSNREITVYFEKLTQHGEEGLYKKSINAGLMRLTKHPEVELLDLAESFFLASKQKGEDEILFTIGKILRRAAHALHRIMAYEKKDFVSDARFLREVK